jgi:hypothetical protein
MNKPLTISAADQISPEVAAIGLKTVFNILDRWGCSPDTAWHILGMKKSTYYKNKDKAHTPKLSRDQIERISYILNIHAALRVVFDNPTNVYGFMSMQNFNPFFNGSAPLEIIAKGNFGALYETFKRIDSLRGGGL